MSITAFARRARTLRLAAAGLTAVAALTLTACNSSEGTGTESEGKADSATSAPADQASGSGGSGGSDATGGASEGKKGGGTEQAGSSKEGAKDGAKDGAKGSGGSGGSEQEIGPCDINKLTVGVKSVQRPVNYMVLEVNNHAGVDCNMPGFPRLRFDDAQAATPVYEDSKPQAVVTLAPGETAYAGIRTSSADGSGQNGYKATSLEVFLEGSDDSKSVELPGGSVYIDENAQVTYWQSDLSNALD
ncbi:DUF4232 domain-containing protein [Streptomyces milbemycinicus]|uniref:DUF4232 domain-containing protein n=1 Tax=Streptomyces milbemycinicus TaxID=476552 RepID=UPI000A3C97A1|nr:DUF4232 domain-containing protein [Streptomyces milbemycinicus]